ncbi:Rv3235 family protein [uncultured Tessaracoccus sp.]|uniref:Rv3235 family protein n=1 Tax=uncultured Tessaracoccus sp. TaxID=905023 RepID=UPI0025F67539|nr:Rv3235 family protein [uncultured Tessaracoccus sp.]
MLTPAGPLAATPTPRPPRAALLLAKAILEAMAGRRPLHHLRTVLSPIAFHHLARARESGHFARTRIGSWRWQMPTSSAAEISIRISLTTRWLVCVVRLDHEAGWSCSDFRVLGI